VIIVTHNYNPLSRDAVTVVGKSSMTQKLVQVYGLRVRNKRGSARPN